MGCDPVMVYAEDGGSACLAEDWHTDCMGLLRERIVVPRGFVTDGASIPRALWPFCGDPMENPRVYAAIVHDYIYSLGGSAVTMAGGTQDFPRRGADRLYRDYQIALGVSRAKAWAEYCALRVFGGGHWEKQK